jgi:hypothetical protein
VSHFSGRAQVGVPRRMSGPKMDEVRGGWRQLHEELHNLYCSPDIIRMIKSRAIKWAWYVEGVGQINGYI